MLSVHPITLRRWEKNGKIAVLRTPTGRRKYSLQIIQSLLRSRPIFKLATEWISDKNGVIPNDEFYCPNIAVFQTRFMRLEKDLASFKELRETYPLIIAAVGEIGNNSFDHNLGNWPDVPGIFFAYDFKKREIALADRGQGIFTTLKRVKPEMTDDAQALSVAFTEIISGRAPEARGNGLKFVRKSIPLSGINLSFQTGNAVLHLDKHSTNLEIKSAKTAFRGCLALIKF